MQPYKIPEELKEKIPFEFDSDEPMGPMAGAGGCFAAFIFLFIIPVSCLTPFSSVNVLYTNETVMWAIFLTLSIPICLGLVMVFWHIIFDEPIESIGNLLYRIFGFFSCIIGAQVFCSIIGFESYPIFMHHLTSHAGQKSITIKDTDSSYMRYHCRPRIHIKEFPSLYSDDVCFRKFKKKYRTPITLSDIQAGDRFIFEGKISKYGIDIERIRKPKK